MNKPNPIINYVCENCHSNDLAFEALGEWDVETEQFVERGER